MQNDNEIIIWFDMDGVLANFDGKVYADDHQRQYLKNWVDTLAKYNLMSLRDKSSEDLKKLFSGEQKTPEMKELKKAWTDLRSNVYKVAEQPGFFFNLDEMPGARELLQLAHSLTGKLPNILTAPMEQNPTCKEDKERWAQKHFAGLYNTFVCDKEKFKHATRNSILIDDKERYVGPFRKAGGHAVLYTSFEQAANDLRSLVNTLKERNAPEGQQPLQEMIKHIVENVLDKMGKKKISNKIRRGALSPEVYVDREQGSEREKEVISQVAKNLNRKPYSHHPPMVGISNTSHNKKTMKEGMGEFLKRLLKEGIEEAKIDDLMNKYHEVPAIEEALEKVKQENIHPKYFPFIERELVQEEQEARRWRASVQFDITQRVLDFTSRLLIAVKDFDTFAKKGLIANKDIGQYKSYQELVKVVTDARKKAKEKDLTKPEAKTIYQSPEYMIIEPLNQAASVKYGRGSKWCISATETKNYFEEYHSQGARFLFVVNKQTGDKDAIAFGEGVPEIEIYDAIDNTQQPKYFNKKYPLDIRIKTNEYLKPIIGRAPFSTLDPNFVNSVIENPSQSIDKVSEIIGLLRDHEDFRNLVRMFISLANGIDSGAIEPEDKKAILGNMDIIAFAVALSNEQGAKDSLMNAAVLLRRITADPSKMNYYINNDIVAELKAYVISSRFNKAPSAHDILLAIFSSPEFTADAEATWVEAKNRGDLGAFTRILDMATYKMASFKQTDTLYYLANFKKQLTPEQMRVILDGDMDSEMWNHIDAQTEKPLISNIWYTFAQVMKDVEANDWDYTGMINKIGAGAEAYGLAHP